MRKLKLWELCLEHPELEKYNDRNTPDFLKAEIEEIYHKQALEKEADRIFENIKLTFGTITFTLLYFSMYFFDSGFKIH